MTLASIVVAIALVAQAVALVMTARRQRSLNSLEERLDRFFAALALLTDTTEAGLQAVAVELVAQRDATAKPRARSARNRRIVHAVRKGRSLAEIAAAERASEGEIRLRLHLAADTMETAHASMRAQ